MKSTTYVFIALACLITAHAEEAKANSTEPLFPAQNKTIDCQKYANCSDNNCHFNGMSGETTNKHFFAGDEFLVTCDNLKVDITFPTGKNSDYMGNKSYTCFKYDNGNSTTFSVAVVNLTKTEDIKGSQIVCTSTQNNCTLNSETATQVVLVAGMPSSCVSLMPPTPAPESTTVPTTPTATQSSASNATNATKTESSTTVSHSTGPTDATPVTPTQASNGTTAASGKGGKDDSSVARLEFAAVLAMAVALFIRHYM